MTDEVWNVIKGGADSIGVVVLAFLAIYGFLTGRIVPGFLFERERSRADETELRLTESLKLSQTYQGVLVEFTERVKDIQDDIRNLPSRMPPGRPK